jgi:hypothetical protein
MNWAARLASARPIGRILAIDMKSLGRPFADLHYGIDQIDELVARLPFKPKIVVLRLIEHHLSCVGMMDDVQSPLAQLPSIAQFSMATLMPLSAAPLVPIIRQSRSQDVLAPSAQQDPRQASVTSLSKSNRASALAPCADQLPLGFVSRQ